MSVSSSIFADTLRDGYTSSKLIIISFANFVLRTPKALLVVTSVFGFLWAFRKIYSFLSMLFSVYIASGRSVSLSISPPLATQMLTALNSFAVMAAKAVGS